MIVLPDNSIVVTGGSDVKEGKWFGCDSRQLDKDKEPTDLQKLVEETVGTFLLARGLVGRTYNYYEYKNLTVIQSHKWGYLKGGTNILFANLLKYLVDHPERNLTIRNPFWFDDDGREKCLSIRRRIHEALDNLSIPTHKGDVPRLMFA